MSHSTDSELFVPRRGKVDRRVSRRRDDRSWRREHLTAMHGA